ncbi:N-acylneuraminate cytidylyltransferase [Desulfonatronum thiosulfatophilum]|uniref:N-acylneuraminate cytidylyltransferase n=1 Tax=Desulfonatronum thiosulfatophilum TaxID=617002 RepID=A0A1G6DV39_9BACT|nr:pseudaminic acid cytidylyltransferase [Desulfonatronum thiosulfatophilum]SDB49023.1 N-acylneuraminate cytidylyltransferase [Desulfonatronum thiosulfatophilum]
MTSVAIIPARGGSKRIPRKNIKDFHGKPMIAYPISVALESRLFDRIIVSTDDEEIADVSMRYGAEVPFMRPKELADDYAGTNAVVRHCLEWLVEKNQKPEYACCIYATTPFLQEEYLRKGLELLKVSGKSFAFTVTTFPSPIQRSVRIRKDGALEAIFPEHVPKRSQDLEEAYHDAGQFYWGKSEAFLNRVALYSPESIPVILPRYLVHDIDTQEDWRMAELMYKALSFYENQ